MSRITPRWLAHCLQWVPVEAGIYRLNRVKDAAAWRWTAPPRDERTLPQTFVDYEEHPREYFLSAVNTVLEVHTRVSDLYSVPHDQIAEQLRLTIEIVKERQESELINNPEYGLLNNVAPSMRLNTRTGRPDARRPRRTDLAGLERARLLPRPSSSDRRFRAGMHKARRSAGDRHDVRLALPDLERHSADPDRQAAYRE